MKVTLKYNTKKSNQCLKLFILNLLLNENNINFEQKKSLKPKKT